MAEAIERPSEVFPTPGGPDEQDDRAARLRIQLADREELEDAVLHALDVVVVAVEHARACFRSRLSSVDFDHGSEAIHSR